MSVAFPADQYGNAASYYDVGPLAAAPPTGPRLVHWMAGGLLSLLTVNGSNLGVAALVPYMRFGSPNRFAGLPFQHACLLRTGKRSHLMPMSLVYPT